MAINVKLENATKAAQCPDLLLQDLLELLANSDALTAFPVLPEIKNIVSTKDGVKPLSQQ